MTWLWAITPEKVDAVIQKIIDVSKPRKLILFGSYVQGKMHVHSDLDILVVTGDEIENPRKEGVRIRRASRFASTVHRQSSWRFGRPAIDSLVKASSMKQTRGSSS